MNDQQVPAAQLDPIGRAGRKLLGRGLEVAQNGRFYLPVAIPAVCHTYAFAPAESEELIRQLIQPKRLAEGGIEGLDCLATSIEALMPAAPALVEDIYRAIFDVADMPDDKVPLYDSQILPLTTTLREEFDGARRRLAEAFGDFLAMAPEHAVRFLAHVLELYITDRPGHAEQPVIFDFPFGDRQARFVADASCIWDQRTTYEHDPPVIMLKGLQEHLAAIASTDNAIARLSAIISHIVSHHQRAVVWRRLLTLATRHPDTLGKLLTPLLKAPIILITPDTYTAAGELLTAVYPHLNDKERHSIEVVIMALPEHALLQDDANRERKRARLLGCLPLDFVASTAARELIAELNAENAIPRNEPLFTLESGGVDPEDIQEILWRSQGIPSDSQENLTFRSVVAPVSDFCDHFFNGQPMLSDAQAILPQIQQLQLAISTGATSGVHEHFLQNGIGTLASACETLSRNAEILADPQARRVITSILLDASSHLIPRHSEESNKQFDRSPSWAGRSPRIEAARGLMLLAGAPEAATQSVMDAIDRLSADPAYAVRFVVAEKLTCLYHSKHEEMWRHIETTAKSDPSNAVLVALTNRTLYPLMEGHIDRVVTLSHGIFDRVGTVEEGRDPRASCLSIMVRAFIEEGQAEASHFLCATLTDGITLYHRELTYVIGELRRTLTLGSVDEPFATQEAMRCRGWQLFQSICRAARIEFDALYRQYGSTPTKQIPSEAVALWQALARLLDTAASELYFASGCFAEKKADQGKEAVRLREEARRRFWSECQPVLDALEPIGLAHAVHHLVEFLEGYIDVAPEQVFIRIGRIIVAAEEGRYQHEAIAADLVVKIVERYLAQYRHVFQANNECRNLIVRILDIFVGWPNARRLAYRLEELYR